MSKKKTKRILFVCTGNTCRSPMAEIILKTKLKLAGITEIKVKSAGLSTADGLPMSDNSKKALKLLGYKPTGFKSKLLTTEILKKTDLVICMTQSHKRAFGNYPGVYTIAELTGLDDVIDPYGQNLDVYIDTSHQLEDACNIILEKIFNSKGDD